MSFCLVDLFDICPSVPFSLEEETAPAPLPGGIQLGRFQVKTLDIVSIYWSFDMFTTNFLY